MAHRQKGQLETPGVEERVAGDKKGVGSLAPKGRKGGINFAAGAGVEDLDLQPHGARGRFHVSQRDLRIHGLGRIDEHGHTCGAGHQSTQQLQFLRPNLEIEEIDTGQVAARPREAGDNTAPDRVFGGEEDDGNRRGRGLGREMQDRNLRW